MITAGQPGQPLVKWTNINAKAFESIGYCDTTRQLFIKFRTTPTLLFEDMPRFRYSGLLAAPRPDAYYQTYIKDRFKTKEAPVG